MCAIDEIVYAEEKSTSLKIIEVRPMDDYKLWVRFNTGEAKIFDVKPLLNQPAFLPLTDEKLFKSVYIDYGVTFGMMAILTFLRSSFMNTVHHHKC